MDFKVTIKTDNAAFEEDFDGEVARLLEEAAYKVRLGYHEGTLVDANGNTVGDWKIEEEN